MKRNFPRARWVWRLAILCLVAGLLVVWNRPSRTNRAIKVAGAKGQIIGSRLLTLSPGDALLRDLALADPAVQARLAGKANDFLYALPLGYGESAEWRAQGCLTFNCVRLVFYDYTAGGAVEAIVNRLTSRVLHVAVDPQARPGASAAILPKVIDIASQAAAVQTVLGDLHKARVAMVPMTVWLTDSPCQEAWCVDLTFHDPQGSGRIFHVVVNMQAGNVARTFYTRPRADRLYQEPPPLDPSRPFYTDGCHSAYDWNVCWEMTANDGVNFYDATYQDKLIFSSAKIGQVEAFYPSWPGGYRDEIGYNASVPPKFDTRITDLGNGFEVRQLFTELFDWPNCICCYRYEQVLRFYADGSFEPSFVSQGPGCDDLSRYQPFWRIDIDLNGETDDKVTAWQGVAWQELDQEIELPLFENLAFDGEKIAVQDGELLYVWQPEVNDPLGQNVGRLFIMREHPGEGDSTIFSGPADTYRPPRQWLNDESLDSGEIVVWYVPTLITKKGGPWWCMPDPEPELSPCSAIMHIRPLEALHQPTAEELLQLQATPTASPPVNGLPPIQPTPRPITGQDAETIILNAGCGACHVIGSLGEAGKVGPNLSNIGRTAAGRVPGQPAAEYLRNSILYPNLYLAAECPNGPCVANAMPGDYYLRLSNAQVDTLVNFLLDQQMAVDTTPAAIGAPAATASAPTGPGESPATGTDGPNYGWVGPAALALILALLWLFKRRPADMSSTDEPPID